MNNNIEDQISLIYDDYVCAIGDLAELLKQSKCEKNKDRKKNIIEKFNIAKQDALLAKDKLTELSEKLRVENIKLDTKSTEQNIYRKMILEITEPLLQKKIKASPCTII